MKKRLHNTCILLIMLLAVTSFSQEEMKGAHELQKEEFGKLENQPFQNRGSYDAIIPLQNRESNTLTKKVFGFLPYWEKTNGANDNLQYDKLSHLACFDFLVQLDASVATPVGWPWTTEINAAHAEGVKVLMTVVNFGGSDDANAVAEELITNTSKQAIFFANIKAIIQAASLDGVNIDFESMLGTTRDADLNTFMTALTTYIHTELPGKEVSFDAPAVLWSGWVIDGLVASVDYLIIMAYDYISASSLNSGPVAPLIKPSNGLSVTRTLEGSLGYSSPVANTPEKLVLAVPYYGRHWKTTSSAAEASTISSEGSTRLRDTEAEALTNGGWIWNTDFEYPWYRWYDGTNWNQVWTDNTQSIEAKFDLSLAKNLGGVGIWALNYDGALPEFWNLIAEKFNDTASIDDFLIESINVYPNPTNQFISINRSIELNKIGLFNLVGQKVLELNPAQNTFDLSGLSSGMYILKVEDLNGNQGAIKIMKSGFNN